MSGTPASHDAAAAPRRKVLVADDVADSRALLASLLRPLVHADIHEARDGTQALLEFKLVAPQLVFLDIEMPGRSGLEVLREIRAQGGSTFIVIVSGHSGVETVQQALQLGVGGFVVKPYSGQRIVDVLRKCARETGDSALLRTVP